MIDINSLNNYASSFSKFVTEGDIFPHEKNIEYANTSIGIFYNDAIQDTKSALYSLKSEDRPAFVSMVVATLYSHHKGGYYFNLLKPKYNVNRATHFHNIIIGHRFKGEIPSTYFEKMFLAYFEAYATYVTHLYSLCYHFNIDLINIQIQNDQIVLHPSLINGVMLDYLGYPQDKQAFAFTRLLEKLNELSQSSIAAPVTSEASDKLNFNNAQLTNLAKKLSSGNYIDKNDIAAFVSQILSNKPDLTKKIEWNGIVSDLNFCIDKIYKSGVTGKWANPRKIFYGEFNNGDIKKQNITKGRNPKMNSFFRGL